MDTALTQTLAAASIVVGAAFFLARRAWHAFGAARRAGKADGSACGGESDGCGCASTASATTEALREPEGVKTGVRR